MDTAVENVGQFTEVDHATESSWFIRFMDMANAVPEYAAIRECLARSLGDLHGRRVLDVGCGTGDDAREVARLVGDSGRVVGTDLSEAMISEARRRSELADPLPVTFDVEDMCHLSFPDGAFDGTRAKLVRQHCADLDRADDELMRVTRPGGRIAVFDYDFETLAVDHPDRAATRKIVHSWVDGHQYGWNGRQLVRRFAARGLKEPELTPYTVLLPFEFFRSSMEGRLAQDQESGNLGLTADELAAWWQPLRTAAAQGRFFASLTGFVLAGTR